MPLTERDPNASRPTSRASNRSTGSKGLSKGSGDRSDHPSAAPGVTSMLKTSTELGDIGSLAYNDSAQSANVPRAPRRGGASSRMSTSSIHSNRSRPDSNHRNRRPSTSSVTRRPGSRENNVLQYVSDTVSPTVTNISLESPPPISRSRNSRNNGRSFSMTATQPVFRLSSNRSFASLRNHNEHPVQRPRSPYHYPTRLRRPGYRPASPAMSDITGTQRARIPGHSKLRTPSEISVYRDDRSSIPSQHGRHRSSGARVEYFHQHLHAGQRAGSEAPSSDPPSSLPPTPKDGTSMEAHFTPTGSRVLDGRMRGAMKPEMPSSPLYYDYSEQFDQETCMEPETETVRTGFVHHIKTIFEDRATMGRTSKEADTMLVEQTTETSISGVAGYAELPASPVAKRITRELILATLDPESAACDDDMSSIMLSNKASNETVHRPNNEKVNDTPLDNGSLASAEQKEKGLQKQSVVSQVRSHKFALTVQDSSAPDFAIRYSIPVANTGDTTEDGMSDLLDGYQHNDTTKDEAEDIPEKNLREEAIEEKNDNSPKPSIEQSFKSCTDTNEDDRKEPQETPQKQAHDEACRKSDSPSLKVSKVTITPDRPIPMPPSKLPMISATKSETKSSQPLPPPEMPLPQSPQLAASSPRGQVSPRESSFPKALSRVRANSKLSSKRSGSVAASISSSSDSIAQQPPTIPPRESSSSKEALRNQAVADFLVRLSRHKKFSRASSSFGKKTAQDEPAAQQEAVGKKPEDGQQQEKLEKSKGKLTVVIQPDENMETPEKCPAAQAVVAQKAGLVETPPYAESLKNSTPAKVLDVPTPSDASDSLKASSLAIPESSSVYSSDVLSSDRLHAQPTVEVSPVTPEDSRRDSQTTTHLVWNGRTSLNRPSEIMAQHRLSQEGTTTDLRLSAYRPHHYLPDLKEESHEDSSLNTSVSNLKNSSFRFPFGQGPSNRASVDETAMFRRNSSVLSPQQSGLSKAGRLPSIRFSRMDLFEKLNEAFDHHDSKSLDGMTYDSHELQAPSPARPMSADGMRDKYRSFFASLDEFEKLPQVNPSKSIIDLPLRRSCSPEQFLAEIDKLTIPSLGGLTQRLSEFLPSLKYYRLSEDDVTRPEEEIMEHAMEELNTVTVPGGPGQKRSSARLRPIPGSPNLVVVDDHVYDELTGENDSSGGGVEGEGGAARSINNRSAGHKTPLAESEVASPAVLRTRSLSLGRGLRLSLDSKLSARRSLRSVTTTPTDSRPWNSDKNYPWASSVPSIDITLPVRTASHVSPLPPPLRLKNGLSDSPDVNNSPVGSGFAGESNISPPKSYPFEAAKSVKAPFEAAKSVKVPFETAKSVKAPFTHHRRTSHRLSLFNRCRSSTMRPNESRASSMDTETYLNVPLSEAHAAGERYPLSALNPPASASMTEFAAETQSHFSDDSDDERRPGLKKKLTNLKTRLTPSSRSQPAMPHISSMQDAEGEARDFSTARRQTFEGAGGMPQGEYRKNKFLETVRGWFHRVKRSALYRTLSGHKDVEGTIIIQPDGQRVVPMKGSRGVVVWTGV
ncbi:hypothetical protein GQ43DRAFT_33492 [Delitschia confertaspora ATCC 74209]|uniref:Uncharacterized protein n=1 Tax=Delitschia confertaspora ATCC 74209 TaxID=1513339 RepID=A0A9P4JNN2_9PLEO|nr:hypothetical protein GQ43DRAFT_33492 [Delitschia confertaspora ATCC 74209]